MLSTQPYKGTRDFYPVDARIQQWMFNKMREVLRTYAYQEYDGPMLEPFELYAAKTGEEIVNQQLYWMIDRGERKIAVRPEMTPTLARMVAGQINEIPRPIRWFSIPNLWRYERPQRGRLREHWQLNADVLGGDTVLADAEILQIAASLMKSFGGEKWISIRVNHRGLMDFLFKERLGLNPETALGVTKAIDARDKIGEESYQKWLTDLGVKTEQIKTLNDFFEQSFEKTASQMSCAGVEQLKKLFGYCKEMGISEQVVFDPKVMRGMDYYTGTVFEIYDVSPENRRALFGGGRYDNLIGLFGKHTLSGIGFGMGDVGLRNFLETHKLLPEFGTFVDVYVSLPKIEYRTKAEEIARELRQKGLRVMTPLEVGGFGNQLKQAAKHQARYAVLFGEDEWSRGSVLLKDLSAGSQKEVKFSEIASAI